MEKYVHGSLLHAASRGNVEFIRSILKSNPELVGVHDELERNIFMHAILHRQANVFSLIHGLSSKLHMATDVDKHGNNLLHMAGMEPCSTHNGISGAALRMQRELQWFKVFYISPFIFTS